MFMLQKLGFQCKFLLWYIYTQVVYVLLYPFFFLRDVIKLRKLNYKSTKKYCKVSFCTTCMNRTTHLKQTYLKNITDNLDYPNVEFILVDYNSSDGLQEWVRENLTEYMEKDIVKVYRTKKPKEFHMSNAKNIAHSMATGDIVCNLDADNYAGKDFAYYINHVCTTNKQPIGFFDKDKLPVNVNSRGIGGRIFLFKKDFLTLGGYDERFSGWGYEDEDFINRAIKLGLKKSPITLPFLNGISHTNTQRDKNHSFDMTNSSMKNKTQMLNNVKKGVVLLRNNISIPSDLKLIK